MSLTENEWEYGVAPYGGVKDCDSTTVTQWYDNGGSATFSAQICHEGDSGRMWVKLALGNTIADISPETLLPMASELWRMALRWQGCRWDSAVDACVSESCAARQGVVHIGRMLPHEAMRRRRYTGERRDREIIHAHFHGLSVSTIAMRVGWSESTVRRVLAAYWGGAQ